MLYTNFEYKCFALAKFLIYWLEFPQIFVYYTIVWQSRNQISDLKFRNYDLNAYWNRLADCDSNKNVLIKTKSQLKALIKNYGRVCD